MQERCAHCKFFASHSGRPSVGSCLRYPPAIARGETPNVDRWPRVHRIDWCGEFRERGAKD